MASREVMRQQVMKMIEERNAQAQFQLKLRTSFRSPSAPSVLRFSPKQADKWRARVMEMIQAERQPPPVAPPGSIRAAVVAGQRTAAARRGPPPPRAVMEKANVPAAEQTVEVSPVERESVSVKLGQDTFQHDYEGFRTPSDFNGPQYGFNEAEGDFGDNDLEVDLGLTD